MIAVVAAVIASLVAVLIRWLPESASEEMDRITFVFWFATIISIGIFALVAAVIIEAVWAFRVQPDDDTDGPPIHGHTGLEIAWTAVPALLVTTIAIAAAVVLTQNSNAGNNPLRITVTAQQFAWQFEYTNGPADGRTEPTLRLPLGRPVELSLHSKDVIHSFWVPQFGQKMDALPDTEEFPHPTELVITPTKLGTFPIICTELCGLGHSLMRSSAVVMRPGEFNSWARSAAS